MKNLFNPIFRFLKPDASQAIIFGGLLLVVLSALLLRFATAERLETKVTYEEEANNGRQVASESVKQLPPDVRLGSYDPGTKTTERVREASAIGLGLSLMLVNERLESNNKVDPDLNAILKRYSSHELFPAGTYLVTPDKPVPFGILTTAAGVYYIRYQPSPLKIEILSSGKKGLEDGSVFVVRLPDTSAVSANLVTSYDSKTIIAGYWATIFVAPDTPNAYLPQPFVGTDVYQRAGWRVEPLRATAYTQEKLATLNNFLKEQGISK